MSMIQRFFEKTEKSNAYLFDGLKINDAGEKYLKHQGQYPVITISLKDMDKSDYGSAFVFFKNAVAEEFGRHNYLKDSSELSEAEKEKYKSKRKNMRNSLPMTVMKK